MPSIETSIWLALRGRVETFDPAWGEFDPAKQVSWPNITFTKPQAGEPKKMLPYLRVNHIPNVNRRLFIGAADPHQRLSLLQIDVCMPKNQDVAVALEIAGKVAAHFPADLKMSAYGVTARVTKAPEVAQPIDDTTHLMVPVTVSIEAFA